MQLIDLALQFGKILPMHETIDDILMHAVLAMGEILDHTMPMQHLDHAGQMALQRRGRSAAGFGFSHRALAFRHAGTWQGSGREFGGPSSRHCGCYGLLTDHTRPIGNCMEIAAEAVTREAADDTPRGRICRAM
jgi:hypothetical protein